MSAAPRLCPDSKKIHCYLAGANFDWLATKAINKGSFSIGCVLWILDDGPRMGPFSLFWSKEQLVNLIETTGTDF